VKTDAVTRYQNGYFAADLVIDLSAIVKWIGFIIAILSLLSPLFIASAAVQSSPSYPVSFHVSSSNNQAMVNAALLAGVVNAVIVFMGFLIVGSLLGVLGHLLKASLDGVVCASPFLTHTEKATLMNLLDPSTGNQSTEDAVSINCPICNSNSAEGIRVCGNCGVELPKC